MTGCLQWLDVGGNEGGRKPAGSALHGACPARKHGAGAGVAVFTGRDASRTWSVARRRVFAGRADAARRQTMVRRAALHALAFAGAEGSEGAPGADQTIRAIPHARCAATCYRGHANAATMREMAKLYFEDFKPGSVTEYGPRLVTREEIVAFAAEFDPQPMHLDEEAARSSMLGGLAASGWHTCCLLMRMAADGFILNSASMGAPGVDEVKWLRPLRPGTRVTLRVNVLESRVSNS